MNILIVLRSFTVGGAEKQSMEIAKNFVEKGAKVTLLTFNQKGGMIEQVPENVKLIVSRRFRMFSVKVLMRVFSLIKTIRTIKPDLIYTSIEYAPVAIAGKLTGTPTMIVFVSDPGRKSKPWIKTVMSNFWSRVGIRFASSIVANSYGVARECRQHFKLKSSPMVIYNGTNLQLVRQRALEDVKHQWLGDKTVPLIVSVGRLVREKDFATLIDAFAIFNKRMKARLLIVGSGKEKNFLMRQIKRFKLDNVVQLVGLQQNPYSFMASANLYVSSSVSEGFSNTLLEAAALGLPIVSTDHKFGANELIEDGKNGLLVPVRDAKAMAEAMERILKNPVLKQNLSIAIKKRAEEFGVDKMVSEYEKLFRKVSNKTNQ